MTEDERDYGALLILAGIIGTDLRDYLHFKSSAWPFCGYIGWLKC